MVSWLLALLTLLLLHHQIEQCGNASAPLARLHCSCILLLVPSVNTAANRTRGKRLQQASLIDKKPQPKRAQLQKTRTAGLKNLQEKK